MACSISVGAQNKLSGRMTMHMCLWELVPLTARPLPCHQQYPKPHTTDIIMPHHQQLYMAYGSTSPLNWSYHLQWMQPPRSAGHAKSEVWTSRGICDKQSCRVTSAPWIAHADCSGQSGPCPWHKQSGGGGGGGWGSPAHSYLLMLFGLAVCTNHSMGFFDISWCPKQVEQSNPRSLFYVPPATQVAPVTQQCEWALRHLNRDIKYGNPLFNCRDCQWKWLCTPRTGGHQWRIRARSRAGSAWVEWWDSSSSRGRTARWRPASTAAPATCPSGSTASAASHPRPRGALVLLQAHHLSGVEPRQVWKTNWRRIWTWYDALQIIKDKTQKTTHLRKKHDMDEWIQWEPCWTRLIHQLTSNLNMVLVLCSTNY